VLSITDSVCRPAPTNRADADGTAPGNAGLARCLRTADRLLRRWRPRSSLRRTGSFVEHSASMLTDTPLSRALLLNMPPSMCRKGGAGQGMSGSKFVRDLGYYVEGITVRDRAVVAYGLP